MTKPVHPFPARMAPGLALESLASLKPGSIVLDPMSGSGTVLRQATDLGHSAHGFDLDPLAVLMSKVWTTPVDDTEIQDCYDAMLDRATARPTWAGLPWIDASEETQKFISYWFAEPQLGALKKLAAAIHEMSNDSQSRFSAAALNVLRLNLSRIIVTKEQAASLARDTSHSRPHRVCTTSEYNVLVGYDRSLGTMRKRLLDTPPRVAAQVSLGDSRALGELANSTVDAVITSPPYLNAIDYLRGHRMALVWLGWTIPELRAIRSASIGAERGMAGELIVHGNSAIVTAMTGGAELGRRHGAMIERYANDLWYMAAETSRVLKSDGKATFVVGNSCLKGVFIKNADGLASAATAWGMKEIARSERDLPEGSRYLPTTGVSLGKRMRTETVMTFTNG